jgi:hypothetical protein
MVSHSREIILSVMAGLDPAIHAFLDAHPRIVDGRLTPAMTG